MCKLDGDLGLGKPQKVLGIKMIAYTFASLMQGASNSFIGTNSLPDYSPPVWQVSEDKTMIAALAAETIESKNRNYEVSVMDENLHEKWKKAQVIPYPEEKTHLQTLSVNNEGSGIVLSARVYDADKIFLITEKRKRSKRNTGSCRC